MPIDKQEHKNLQTEAEGVPATCQSSFLLFQGLCVPFSEPGIARLREQMVETAEWLTQLAFRSDQFNVELAVELCARAVTLIDHFNDFNQQQQLLVIGAVQYLLFRNDTVPDSKATNGLEDDRRIINYVLWRLGLFDALVAPQPTPTEQPQSPRSQENPLPTSSVSPQTRREWKALRDKMKTKQI